MIRRWLCRRGWHGWATWLGFDPRGRGRLAVHRVCVRAGCGAEEWQ